MVGDYVRGTLVYAGCFCYRLALLATLAALTLTLARGTADARSDAKAGAFSRDGKAAAAALAERRKKKKRRRRVKTVCYYVSRRAAPSHSVLRARTRARARAP